MTLPSADFRNLRVFHTVGDDIPRQFEIDLRLAEQEARYDLLVEVGVCRKTDSQARLGDACPLAACIRAASDSGSSVCIFPTSLQSSS